MRSSVRSPSPVVVVIALALGACQPAASSPAPFTTPPVSPPPAVTAAARATAPLAASATPGRSAVLSELRNDVRACPAAAMAWELAAEGQCIYAGGGVRTGAEARVRLDLSEGVIVRLAANTVFALQSASPPPADYSARLSLAAGKLWLGVLTALGFQQIDVETPSGVATVRGSFMSVEYLETARRLIVTCLEGHCRLTGVSGRFTELTNGQQADIAAPGQDPSAARPMEAGQYADWATNCPEAPRPTPTLTPTSPPTDRPPATRTPHPTATPVSPPPTAEPTFTHVLLSPGAGQCGAVTVPPGVVEFGYGVGRWQTPEEASAAVGDSLPTITLNGEPLSITGRTGPEWHTGGEPAGWGFSTRTVVTLGPGEYTLVSHWVWPEVFTCQLTVGGR